MLMSNFVVIKSADFNDDLILNNLKILNFQ